METTFYHDVGLGDNLKGKMNTLRSKMTLDFNNGSPAKKKSLGQILASPDMNMLKLASPELEKMIIQHNGMITTTPTPTQILFPKSVTEEQEAYARGFMDALAKLHKTEDDEDAVPTNYVPDTDTQLGNEPDTYITLQNASHKLATLQNVPVTNNYSFTTTTSLPGSVINHNHTLPSTVNTHTYQQNTSISEIPRNHSPYVVPSNVRRLKEEPQTVPSLGSTPPMSPPMMSPINMEDQECQKGERKRARNRVAARKCRYRKLERISRLEDKVSELRNVNTSLSTDATNLKEQVLRLKQQILEHVNSGCNIMTTGT